MKLIKDLPKLTFMGLVKIYTYCISPYLRGSCRFQPTCSAYAYESFRAHGALKGLMLTLKRIGKCHPWGTYGFDPVPTKKRVKI